MSANTITPAPTGPADQPGDDLGPLPRIARPLVDWVARIRATVHTKLLAGFLLIALLLLSMGVLSIVVLGRVNRALHGRLVRKLLGDGRAAARECGG